MRAILKICKIYLHIKFKVYNICHRHNLHNELVSRSIDLRFN